MSFSFSGGTAYFIADALQLHAVASAPSMGTATTGSAELVFRTEVRRPDRGEHWSDPLVATAPCRACLGPQPKLDAAQVGADIGLVGVAFVVCGIQACRFWRE